MQLQITTDYAIRIVGHLCVQEESHGTSVQAKDLAEELGITYQYCMKVVKQLKDADIVSSSRGCYGGYRITEKGKEVTLNDVVNIMEGKICLNKCLEEDGVCSRHATDYCPVHNVLKGLQTQIIESLDSYKVRDIWMEEMQ